MNSGQSSGKCVCFLCLFSLLFWLGCSHFSHLTCTWVISSFSLSLSLVLPPSFFWFPVAKSPDWVSDQLRFINSQYVWFHELISECRINVVGETFSKWCLFTCPCFFLESIEQMKLPYMCELINSFLGLLLWFLLQFFGFFLHDLVWLLDYLLGGSRPVWSPNVLQWLFVTIFSDYISNDFKLFFIQVFVLQKFDSDFLIDLIWQLIVGVD